MHLLKTALCIVVVNLGADQSMGKSHDSIIIIIIILVLSFVECCFFHKILPSRFCVHENAVGAGWTLDTYVPVFTREPQRWPMWLKCVWEQSFWLNGIGGIHSHESKSFMLICTEQSLHWDIDFTCCKELIEIKLNELCKDFHFLYLSHLIVQLVIC